MVPQEPYTVAPLHKRVMSLQGDEPAWKLNKNSSHDYCAASAHTSYLAKNRGLLDLKREDLSRCHQDQRNNMDNRGAVAAYP